ncbi:MAG TPA: DUF5982 domain-containing protein [Kofleriaceae bacterium]|nr:DUF5982 domain-containing protein [Kofleriaceae bacterium]
MRPPALAACVLVVCAGVARADGLSPADLARKNEGSHLTGVPLVAYSVDFGFGVGVRGYYFWNGRRDDARFAYTPYLHRIFLQTFATTGGAQFHWLDYDAPEIFESPYRIRSSLLIARNTDAAYYGFGDAGRTLRFPGSPDGFRSYDDYRAALRRVDESTGEAYTKYNALDALRPVFLLGVERSFFGKRLRVLGGIGAAYVRIGDYTGTRVDAVDAAGAEVRAVQAKTKLQEDCDAGLIYGCDGGRDHFLRLAIAFDTRDFEPDPNRGVFADLELDTATVALGGEYTYAKALGAVRGWWSPFPEHADLVLAGRVLAQWQSRKTPFFAMPIMPFTEDPRYGMGGHRTMRGFRQDRFIGNFEALANAEIRWTFARMTVKRQKFAFIAAPFFDYGRAFDRISEATFRSWLPSYGGAFRVSWNLSTIGTFEYGISREGTGFYANFGHMF